MNFKIIELEILDSLYKKIQLSEYSILDKMGYLTKWLNLNLRINSDQVFAEIQQRTKHLSIEKNKTEKIAECYLHSLKDIECGNFRATRNIKSDYRLHTNLTNMPSFFRKSISYAGDKLASVDIKNSQPYFLIVFIDYLLNFSDSRPNSFPIRKIFWNKREDRMRINIKRVYRDIGTMLQILQPTLSSREFQAEFEKIKLDIIDGTFYDSLIPYFEYPVNSKGIIFKKLYDRTTSKTRIFEFETKRDVVKKLVMFFLYKSNRNEKGDYEIFKSEYPNFCKLLELLKRNNNKSLPTLLQHIESDCVINYTCKNIARNHPEMPLFTIHDSIVTTVPNKEILYEEMLYYITEYCGNISPNLKTEIWK